VNRPDIAWTTLASSGATCVVVHEWAFEGAAGREVSQWLTSRGARLLAIFGSSRVYDLPPPADTTQPSDRPTLR